MKQEVGIVVDPNVAESKASVGDADEAVDAAIGPAAIPRKDQVQAVQLVSVAADRGQGLAGRTMWIVYATGFEQRRFGPGGTTESGKAVTYIGTAMAFVDPSTMKIVQMATY